MTELFTRVTGQHIIPMRKYDQTRVVRSIVRELREDGHPIANGKNGYYLATSTAALKPTIDKFHQRAMSSLKTEAALRKIDPSGVIQQYQLELNQEKEGTSNG